MDLQRVIREFPIPPQALLQAFYGTYSETRKSGERDSWKRKTPTPLDPPPNWTYPVWTLIHAGLQVYRIRSADPSLRRAQIWHRTTTQLGALAGWFASQRSFWGEQACHWALFASSIAYRSELRRKGALDPADRLIRWSAEAQVGWMLVNVASGLSRAFNSSRPGPGRDLILLGGLAWTGHAMFKRTRWRGLPAALAWGLGAAALEKRNPPVARFASAAIAASFLSTVFRRR